MIVLQNIIRYTRGVQGHCFRWGLW